MTFTGWLTIFLFCGILTALAIPFGSYMAAVYTGERTFMDRVVGGPERLLYRVMRVDPTKGQDWKAYAKSLIIFSLAGWLLLYFILRTQNLWSFTGLNPQGFHSAPWNVTFNTTSSFLTNTNWQYYGGETTMSYFSQMAGLTVQNFLSAGVGSSSPWRWSAGIISRSGKSLGNFWQDIVRTVLYVLMPVSIVIALVLVSQGVIAELHLVSECARDHRAVADARDGPRRLSGGDQGCSGPTAAASSTSTRRIRSRTRPDSRTSSRCWQCC